MSIYHATDANKCKTIYHKTLDGAIEEVLENSVSIVGHNYIHNMEIKSTKVVNIYETCNGYQIAIDIIGNNNLASMNMFGQYINLPGNKVYSGKLYRPIDVYKTDDKIILAKGSAVQVNGVVYHGPGGMHRDLEDVIILPKA